ASVVRMEAEAPVPVELGVEPRTDDEPGLRRDRRIFARPRVQRDVAVDVEEVEVAANSRDRAELVDDLDLALIVEPDARLEHLVVAHGAHAHAVARSKEADVGDEVVPHLEADRVVERTVGDLEREVVREVESRHEPLVDLVDLIALDGVVEEESEIREEVELVVLRVEIETSLGLVVPL